MKTLFKLWAIIFALLLAACQGDDNTDNGGGDIDPPIDVPVLTAPANGAADVSLTPTFEWETSGEDALYDLLLSDDGGTTWNPAAEGLDALDHTLTQELAWETTYSWKVAATRGEEEEESAVFTFTTIAEPTEPIVPGEHDDPGAPYSDGDAYFYFDSPKASPLHIIVTGEGFTQTDHDNGHFNQTVDAMMDVFFKVEPYKTYKDYFEIHKLVSISQDGGISIAGSRPENPPLRPALPARSRTTKFGLQLESGTNTSIAIPSKWGVVPVWGIYDYMKPFFSDIPTASWDGKVLIFIVVNENAWAGTNHPIPSNGQAVVITCLPALAGGGTDFGIALHESGHATGMLGDEYYSGSSKIPQSEINRVENVRKGNPWNYFANIDFSGDKDKALWAKYYNLPGYEDVGYYEGGYTYGKGVWRSSQQSLMRNDYKTLWFNVICREAIVRRLMGIAGETFDFEAFLARDVN
jgi:hypothetical protein